MAGRDIAVVVPVERERWERALADPGRSATVERQVLGRAIERARELAHAAGRVIRYDAVRVRMTDDPEALELFEPEVRLDPAAWVFVETVWHTMGRPLTNGEG